MNTSLRPDLLILFCCLLFGLIGISGFELLMANLYQDDGPVFYARAFVDPGRYAGDILYGWPQEMAVLFTISISALMWIPALLLSVFGIDPYYPTLVLCFVQGAGLAWTIYVLSRVSGATWYVAAIAMTFALSTGLWGWNLANFATDWEWIFIPYAALLSYTPILLAFSALVLDRRWASMVLFAIAGLVHPNVTLYALGTVGIYYLTAWISKDKHISVAQWIGLFVVLGITLFPALWAEARFSIDALSFEDALPGLKQSQHVWPWDSTKRFYRTVPACISVLVIAFLGLQYRKTLSNNYLRIWTSSSIAVFFIGLTHVIGGILLVPSFLNLVGLRSFSIVLLLSLPLVGTYLWNQLASGHWLRAVMAISVLGLPFIGLIDGSEVHYAIIPALVLALVFADLSDGALGPFVVELSSPQKRIAAIISVIVTISWFSLFLIFPDVNVKSYLTYSYWIILGDVPTFIWRLIFSILVLSFGTLIYFCYARKLEGVKFFVPAVFVGLVLLQQWAHPTTNSSVVGDFLEIQKWARNSSPEEALFVVPEQRGWRTLSERRRLNPVTRESSAYLAPVEGAAHRAKLLSLYGISPSFAEENRGKPLKKLQRKKFRDFSEDDLILFRDHFGASFVVLRRTKAVDTLTLPVAFRNDTYAVLGLDREEDK